MRFSTTFRSFMIVGVLLGTSTLVYAQSVTDHPRVVEAVNLVEIWLGAHKDYNNIPGISAGVVYDQNLIWSEGFGYTDLESRNPATPSSIYSICSISKLFTSIGVMQLRDMGKFRLDDEVGSLLSWFDLKQSQSGGAPITIEGILTHSAGLPRESDYPYWTDPFLFPSREEIITRLSSQETLYPAWKYYQYSNLGLTLAGEIVSQVSGQSYGNYMGDFILEPLGMTSTVPEIGDAWGHAQMATYSWLQRHSPVTVGLSDHGSEPV